MNIPGFSRIPVIKRYHYQWVMLIGIFWMLYDQLKFFTTVYTRGVDDYPFRYINTELIIVRACIVFTTSCWMGYLLLFYFKKRFNHLSLWYGVLFKTIMLSAITFLLQTVLFFICYLFIYKYSLERTTNIFVNYTFKNTWMVSNISSRIMLFITTMLIIEVNEKYSPGVFKDMLSGKYIEPQEEKKIIMFIDLKDSTITAESLGHKKYFLFMRDFIHYVSVALLEHNANIYQYVGDEIVVSWPFMEENKQKCLQSLADIRKNLQKRTNIFKKKYGVIPEFRIGIHVGEVMVGEIGPIKKDLAMSGDAMNTTARIKTVTNELDRDIIASKDFVDAMELHEPEAESLGMIDLKGKELAIELFALKG